MRPLRRAGPHSHIGQIGKAAGWTAPAAEAPTAATKISAIRPSTRSINTTVAASVLERAAFAVSLMRITSPPMLLGRKLLKKLATRNEPRSQRRRRFTSCARKSRCQRQVLAIMLTA